VTGGAIVRRVVTLLSGFVRIVRLIAIAMAVSASAATSATAAAANVITAFFTVGVSIAL
jgi:hypothetical protein